MTPEERAQVRAEAIKDAAEVCRWRARNYRACGYKLDPKKPEIGAEAIAEECAFFVENMDMPKSPTELMETT